MVSLWHHPPNQERIGKPVFFLLALLNTEIPTCVGDILWYVSAYSHMTYESGDLVNIVNSRFQSGEPDKVYFVTLRLLE